MQTMISQNYNMRPRLQGALLLNTRGVAYLLTGKVNDAVNCFKSTLGIIYELMENDSTRESTIPHEPLRLPVPFLKDDFFHIYNSALLLERGEDALSEGTDRSFTILASVTTLFNLSLATHLLGMANKNLDRIQNACNLYCNCLRLAQDTLPVENPTRGLLYVAITNNLAHIHYRILVNPDKAREIMAVIVGPWHANEALPVDDHHRDPSFPSEQCRAIMVNRIIIHGSVPGSISPAA
jgi:hypothetical protein